MTSSTSNSRAERESPGRWPPPSGLFIALAIMLVIESLTAIFYPSYRRRDLSKYRFYSAGVKPTLEESVIQWQVYHLLESIDEPQDLLLLGDSSCLMGLKPEVFIEENSLETWNLGTVAWISTQGHAKVLEMYLERFAPPRLLVYHVTADQLVMSMKKLESKRLFKRFSRWIEPDSSEFSFLPSLRYRLETPRIMRVLFGLISRNKEDALLNKRRGAFPSDNDVRKILLAQRGFIAENRPYTWPGAPMSWSGRFSKDCEPGLRHILDLSERYDFDVLFVLNPYPVIARTETTANSLEKIKVELSRILKPYRRASLYSPFIRYYPLDLMARLQHVSAEGAADNSRDISRWIKENKRY